MRALTVRGLTLVVAVWISTATAAAQERGGAGQVPTAAAQIRTDSIVRPSSTITAEEVSLAVRLALANERVIALFGGRIPSFQVTAGSPTSIEPGTAIATALRVSGGPPTDPCARARCAVVCFWVTDRFVLVDRVFVDLQSRVVMVR